MKKRNNRVSLIKKSIEQSMLMKKSKREKDLEERFKQINERGKIRIEKEMIDKKTEKIKAMLKDKLKSNEENGILGEETNSQPDVNVKISDLRERIKAMPVTYEEVQLKIKQNDENERKIALKEFIHENFSHNKNVKKYRFEDMDKENNEIITIKYVLVGEKQEHTMTVNKKDLVKWKNENDKKKEQEQK